jgi:hypothetical protein
MNRSKSVAFVLVLFCAAVLIPTASAQGPIGPTHTDPAWHSEYFNNMDLGGLPVLTRFDENLDFNWGTGSPDPQIHPDHFSLRATRVLDLQAGTYTFYATSDDGVRLWVDGLLLIDQWKDQGATTYSSQVYLGTGHHVVQVAYYENGGGALLHVWWEGPGGVYPEWKGEYFDNPNLLGMPVLTRNDQSIQFDWGSGSPGPRVPPDNFSVRWTRTLRFDAGYYRFYVTADDGIRLQVDDHRLIDQWHDQPPTSYSADMYLLAGNHKLLVEFYEHGGGATAKVSWERLSTPQNTWQAAYFGNPSLSGSPTFTRSDPAINFDWGTGSPDPRLYPDGFSVRWTRTVNFPQSRLYTFYARTDDGVRLFVDGHPVIDHWVDQPATTVSADSFVSAGNHTLKVEYYENGGYAFAKVWWEPGAADGSAQTVIVDELDAGFRWGGPLSGQYESSIGYRGHTYYTYNLATGLSNSGRWIPGLPSAGKYEVFVFVPRRNANTHSARYRIYHAGQRTDRVINQAIYYDQWVSLGTYWFAASGNEYVFLGDATGEPIISRRIALDAVKFVRR